MLCFPLISYLYLFLESPCTEFRPLFILFRKLNQITRAVGPRPADTRVELQIGQNVPPLETENAVSGDGKCRQ